MHKTRYINIYTINMKYNNNKYISIEYLQKCCFNKYL